MSKDSDFRVKLKKIMERHIKDEVIFSPIKTPLEHYLQSALYHLHAVIDGDDLNELYYSKKYGKQGK